MRRRALLIGTEVYRDPGFARLPSTRADTAELAAVLRDRAIGGFDVTVETDPTADRMRSVIAQFCRDSVAGELTLIYLSGHGARGPDGEFAFVAGDTERGRLAETGVLAGFVNRCLEDCWASQRIAVFDTCESGSFSIGFRTRDAKGSAPVPAAPVAPLHTRGVYVLASSDVAQSSYSGEDSTVAAPTPSVFTGAVVDILREGSAGTSASGLVSVDDLYDAVYRRLLSLDPPQTPLKSSNGVSGTISIAARPLGAVRRETIERQVTPGTPAPEPDSVPDWPGLLRYYADVVRADTDRTPLLTVGSDDHVVLTGAERVLRGVLDEDGTVPMPAGAEDLVRRAAAENGPALWVGWPVVVLHAETPGGRRLRQPGCAPLLMRQVEVVSDERGLLLLPEGEIVPHPGLAAAWLGDEEAAELASSYRPTWHHGESDRMAQDAGQLLTDTFGMPCIEELRPEHLSAYIDLATPGAGARNASVLFGIDSDAATAGLLKDLGAILRKPTGITGTALAALYPGTDPALPAPDLPLTMPLPANPAQQDVLRGAMTRRLTVATGPPGTGKSQLVVDAVATAVAAGQSVLVASTNNRAVDEVHERCEKILPGLMIRTGGVAARRTEADGLESLLRAEPPQRSEQTRAQAFAHAGRGLAGVEARTREIAAREVELLELGRVRSDAEQVLGTTASELDERGGTTWRTRSEELARAWFFGELRRRRFLQPLGCALDTTTATCEALTRLADVDRRWQDTCSVVATHPPDRELLAELNRARAAHAQSSAERVAGAVADRARQGARPIQELWQRVTHRDQDWGELRRARPHLKGWAVTSLSAKRFPPNPASFDLVVIDEASQCTIPSIVPLLFRARRALVIGDKMQLPHIVSVRDHADAVLRARHDVSRHWLGDHQLSPVKHSAFAAAQHAAGEPQLLDEHYRCHPEIIGIANRLFYQGRLTVLTDLRTEGRVVLDGPAIVWRDVVGHAERGRSGRSWRNPAEADEVCRVVTELHDTVPENATIGVVTPYRAQADELERLLEAHADRVRVGTAHRFQGGERDIMVFSLVAAQNHAPRTFDWIDQQPELWNVAITRARSRLVVVGDEALWARRGRVGAELVHAAGGPVAAGGPLLDEEIAERLYSRLVDVSGPAVEVGVAVGGHHADGLTPDGRAVLADPGHARDVDPAAHLHRILRRTSLLGPDAVRIPAWGLHGDGAEARRRIAAPNGEKSGR